MPDEKESTPGSIPHPDSCRSARYAEGLGVMLADGNVWSLPRAGLWRALRAVRDEMYDQSTLHGQVDVSILRRVLCYLLRANYALTEDQVGQLVRDVDPASYADAVYDAVVPITPGRRRLTDWARSALIANGIDPADVSADDLPHVLWQLVLTDRAVPPSDYTEAGEAAGKRTSLMDLAQRLKDEAAGRVVASPEVA